MVIYKQYFIPRNISCVVIYKQYAEYFVALYGGISHPLLAMSHREIFRSWRCTWNISPVVYIQTILYCRTFRVITSNIVSRNICNVIYVKYFVRCVTSNIVSRSISFVVIYKQCYGIFRNVTRQYCIAKYFIHHIRNISYCNDTQTISCCRIFRHIARNIVSQNIETISYCRIFRGIIRYWIEKYFMYVQTIVAEFFVNGVTQATLHRGIFVRGISYTRNISSRK